MEPSIALNDSCQDWCTDIGIYSFIISYKPRVGILIIEMTTVDECEGTAFYAYNEGKDAGICKWAEIENFNPAKLQYSFEWSTLLSQV